MAPASRHTETTPGKTRFISVLVRGLIILYGLPAIAIALTTYVSSNVTGIAIILLCVPAVAIMRDYVVIGMVLAFLGTGLAAVVNISVYEAARISNGPHLKNMTVHEAALVEDAIVFEFTEAEIQQDYTHYCESTGTDVPSYTVAPLTDPDWNPQRPVSAWVVAKNPEGLKEWKTMHQAGLRVDTDREVLSEIRRAIKEAEEPRGLSSIQSPLLVQWSDPQKVAKEAIEQIKPALIIPFPIWFIGLSLYWMLRVSREEPEDPEASNHSAL